MSFSIANNYLANTAIRAAYLAKEGADTVPSHLTKTAKKAYELAAQNIPTLQEAMEEYSLDKNSEIQNSLTEAYKKVLNNSFTSTYTPSILPTEDGSTNSINKDSVLIDGKIYEVKTGQKTNSGFCSLAQIKGEYVEIDGKQYDVINVPDTNSMDGTKKAIVYDGKTYYVGNSLNLQAQQAFKQVFSNAFEKLFSQE